MLGEGTVFFGVLAGQGPGRIARNRLESCAQFVGNENFLFRPGLTPVDRRHTAGKDRKMK
jgi:hypothetical protein